MTDNKSTSRAAVTLPPRHGGYRPSPSGRSSVGRSSSPPKPPSGKGGGSKASNG